MVEYTGGVAATATHPLSGSQRVPVDPLPDFSSTQVRHGRTSFRRVRENHSRQPGFRVDVDARRHGRSVEYFLDLGLVVDVEGVHPFHVADSAFGVLSLFVSVVSPVIAREERCGLSCHGSGNGVRGAGTGLRLFPPLVVAARALEREQMLVLGEGNIEMDVGPRLALVVVEAAVEASEAPLKRPEVLRGFAAPNPGTREVRVLVDPGSNGHAARVLVEAESGLLIYGDDSREETLFAVSLGYDFCEHVRLLQGFVEFSLVCEEEVIEPVDEGAAETSGGGLELAYGCGGGRAQIGHLGVFTAAFRFLRRGRGGFASTLLLALRRPGFSSFLRLVFLRIGGRMLRTVPGPLLGRAGGRWESRLGHKLVDDADDRGVEPMLRVLLGIQRHGRVDVEVVQVGEDPFRFVRVEAEQVQHTAEGLRPRHPADHPLFVAQRDQPLRHAQRGCLRVAGEVPEGVLTGGEGEDGGSGFAFQVVLGSEV